ncbi:ABC transporter permease subunit [Shewanella sp.]|uniref:ABC transporter permease subunit n=1 Tax=Shewanella sp. TaxID=50422 RepID=UPI003A982ABA
MERQVAKPALLKHDILQARRGNRRAVKDKLTQLGVSFGGIMVFVALLLIFFYLLYVINPIFASASVTPKARIAMPASPSPVLLLGSDEQRQQLYRVLHNGTVDFVSAVNQQVRHQSLPMPAGTKITSAARSMPSQQAFAFGFNNGQVLLANIDFVVTYPNNQRLITPAIRYPLSEPTMQLAPAGQAVNQLAFAYRQQQMSFIYMDDAQHWHLVRMAGEQNLLTEEVEWQTSRQSLPDTPNKVSQQLLTPDQQQALLLSGNKLFVYDIQDANNVSLQQVVALERANANVTEVELLAGASSVLVVYSDGVVAQYFQVNGDNGRRYQYIRQFAKLGHIDDLASEFYRRSFATVSDGGQLTLLYTTSERELLSQQLPLNNVQAAAFSPRADGLVVATADSLQLFDVTNAHPEVSWSALWQKVWYEGYPQPDYVWQSTSGTDDFEAKFSLTPLAFGTLKAALYAMLFATPIALAGAIYTAYFMSGKVRAVVKPTIEIMEALPTVILGFLAGLWLAPLVESHLPGLLMLLIFEPIGVLLVAYAWSKSPAVVKQWLPENYQELLLIPVVCFVGWLCFHLSPAVELWLFDGDSRLFITQTLGLGFDQRNALVVGIAMGFAVIPTIFSIAEDAIFSVPRHLSNGSLALGATPWQTLTRVVLLTASPGIFSAVMMGLGRAVGETMIVLMATGNTAIMNWSMFEGMRTLAANIAVEMPESAIGSSHYRVLFLAAFVLFLFTFVFNTIAEVVRQRLRERYSSL